MYCGTKLQHTAQDRPGLPQTALQHTAQDHPGLPQTKLQHSGWTFTQRDLRVRRRRPLHTPPGWTFTERDVRA